MATTSTATDLAPRLRTAIARTARRMRQAATRLLARLEESGLVTRAPDPADGRSSLISATPEARRLMARQRTRKDAFLHAQLERLDPGDRATLLRATELLEALLEEEPLP